MVNTTGMTEISEVPGITEPILSLLREVELDTVEILLSLEAGEVLQRLENAIAHHGESMKCPSIDLVKAWQDSGRSLLRKRVGALAPEAQEVSPGSLEGEGVSLAALPVARVLADGSRDRMHGKTVPAGVPDGENAGTETRRDSSVADSPETGMVFRNLEDLSRSGSRGERRSRGMSHPDAGKVRWAAMVTVMTASLSVLAMLGLLVAGSMMLFFGARFHSSITLLLLVFPFCLILYLLQAVKVRCRLCGQRLFVAKKCQKHERAVKSILGYGFAMARDAVIFSSFRCMYCGTKTRLKE